jgi:hypothetical protein
MEALLKAGADPNLTDEKGNAPMKFAGNREESEKVELLRGEFRFACSIWGRMSP